MKLKTKPEVVLQKVLTTIQEIKLKLRMLFKFIELDSNNQKRKSKYRIHSYKVARVSRPTQKRSVRIRSL